MQQTDKLLDKYVSSDQIAKLAGMDLRWVQRQTRRLGMRPALTLGERQWHRLDALKLILLARLQASLGETSPIPFQIVAAAEPELNDLLHSPDRGAVLLMPAFGINLVVGVPPLAELVGAA